MIIKNRTQMDEQKKLEQKRLQLIAESLQARLDGISNGEKIPEEVIVKFKQELKIVLEHNQAVVESSKVYPPDYNVRYSNNPYNL